MRNIATFSIRVKRSAGDGAAIGVISWSVFGIRRLVLSQLFLPLVQVKQGLHGGGLRQVEVVL